MKKIKNFLKYICCLYFRHDFREYDFIFDNVYITKCERCQKEYIYLKNANDYMFMKKHDKKILLDLKNKTS